VLNGGPGSRPGLASGICGGQSGVEADFLPSTPGRYNRPVVAAVPSGPSMD
jgi:hypothetical protein